MVLAGGEGQRLHPLTSQTAKPGVRFGGTYRMIDFTLSNCINSGLRRIHLLTQYASTSLSRHVRRTWAARLSDDLDEFVDFVPPQRLFADRWYAGTADAIFQNLFILQEGRPDAVVLLSGDHAYKMDYGAMLAHHERMGADLTIAALTVPRESATQLGVMEADASGRVVGFLEKPEDPPGMPGRPDVALVNMGVYVWRTKALVEAVSADARTKSTHDFGRDVIPAAVQQGRPIYIHEFADPAGSPRPYWRDIGTLESYWQAHMDLIAPVPELDLYDGSWPIYTYKPPLPPAKVVCGTDDCAASVSDCLLTAGCIVSGGKVQRSVLSPGARVESGAQVNECVLMDDVVVGAGASLHRVIVDEGVRIPPGFRIGHDPEEDAKRFVVTSGITVVPRRVVLD
ncbi:MAG: glucose-1-phosphate adenylyltransferase [Armatimonadetes bacterium]|nr:glucose-1-phosphate adenylyltransferase [Armatimonadota bacterium]